MKTDPWLRGALGLTGDQTPFPWQDALLAQFLRGQIVRALDIPTGLGKTAAMAAWLVARGRGAAIPRRLAYVVDRRAVVDQATRFAESLRAYVAINPELKVGLGLSESQDLPISTLRGQHADNRQWLADPAAPAIIVGTVDMIGSRLLFEGYGVSRKMRPYHAGLLGADTLIVLDEAHLVPPFEKLIEAIAGDRGDLGPDGDERRRSVPELALLSLSATGRKSTGETVGLTEADFRHPVVKQRLAAPKRVTTVALEDGALPEVLAKHAWRLAQEDTRAIRCVVYCDSRRHADQTQAELTRLAGDRAVVELFVGQRRVHERTEAARWLEAHGFLAGSSADRNQPAFVVATSAGEVGVDLDADHMVSDLVAWERMVQRFGRVNRRGHGQAEVVVVVAPDPEPDKAAASARARDEEDRDDDDRAAIARHDKVIAQARALRSALALLPAGDASPGALLELKRRAAGEPDLQQVLDAATTPAPLRPELTRAVVDAWSMTSLVQDPGRPEIAGWLRGWVRDEPQTTVVWRSYLPVRAGRKQPTAEIEAYFEAAPPHLEETLEAPTGMVVTWLLARVRATRQRRDAATGEAASSPLDQDVVAMILSPRGDLVRARTLYQLDIERVADKRVAKRVQDELESDLREATLIVDARIGGLRAGLLDAAYDDVPPTADAPKKAAAEADARPDDVPRAADAGDNRWATGFKVHLAHGEHSSERGWAESFRFVLDVTPDGEPSKWLVVEGAETEEKRAQGKLQLLDEHQDWARRRAQQIAGRLQLSGELGRALAIAARLHDEGKRAERWQRAFTAPRGTEKYAKTPGPINVHLLDGYRHEFGSLPHASRDPELQALPDDLRDLVLHLIVAHHGHGRPVIATSGCEDAPPSALEDRAREVALRFFRLQRQWGPWGLAWLEALLRAADQLASQDNDSRERP